MSYLFENQRSMAARMQIEFLTGSTETIVSSLTEAVRASRHGAKPTVFTYRAEAALRPIISALVWLRDHEQRPITHDEVCRFTNLEVLRSLAVDHVIPAAAGTELVEVPDFSPVIGKEIINYLLEIPGVDIADANTVGKAASATRFHAMCMMELRPGLAVMKSEAEAA